ncbi:MAG: DUF58 domain-containing protein [Limisphaerales bacterium]
MEASFLSPKLLRQLDQLELQARRRSRSSGRGERRSKARGQSVEFADHRSYVAGDDVRRLDWNLYGRLDRLFVKLYEEERELPVQILLDASESMLFGTPSKFDFAKRLAGAIGYVALGGFDRVTVRLFPDPAPGGVGKGDGSIDGASVVAAGGTGMGEAAYRSALRGVQGKKLATAFFQNLARVRAGGAGDFNESLRLCALQTRQAGLAIVFSDLLDPKGYAPGLDALLGRGFHIHVVQVLAPEELEPSAFGDLRLVDSETDAEQEVTFGRFRMKAYRRAVENYTQKLREYCRSRGIGFLRVTSEASVESVVLRELREGALLR